MTELPLGGIPEERSRETPADLICGVFAYIEGDGVYSSLDTLSGPQLEAQAAALIEELRRRGQYHFAMAHPADDSDLPAEITAAVASLGYPLENFDVVQASGLRAQLISRDVMTRRRTDRREIFAAGLELLITPRRGQPEELLIGQRGMVYICEL